MLYWSALNKQDKMKIFYVVILIIIFPFYTSLHAQCTVTADTAGYNKDRRELKRLYESTNGSSWVNKWDTSTVLNNSWYGVTMSSNGCRVRIISILNNNVTGSLPEDPDLSELITFRIYNSNNTYGKISGNLPDMSKLTKIELINLTSNQIEGTLPATFPNSIKNLILTNNRFSGSVPDYNLSNLTELRLNGNQLTGSIPSFSNLTSLQNLSLATNQLTSSIPNFSISTLVSIDLSNNQLSGSIPDFNLSNLKILTLNNNQLTGTLPLFQNTALTEMRLSENLISDTVPNYQISTLQLIHLTSNPLYGTLPDFNALVNLKDLRINGCNMEGELPLFTNNTLLEIIYLGANNLSGSIPNYNLPKLRLLNIPSNKLTGVLQNYNLPALTNFTASENMLSGLLPAFNAMPKLTDLILSNNRLCGPLPGNMSLPALSYLTLGQNLFSGEIPSTFVADLPKITDVRLNNNYLQGTIPDFSSATLFRLYVGDNKLTGPLPSFNNALKLKEFSAAYNLLNGPIPDYKARPGSDTSNMYIVLSNNSFSFGDIATSSYNTINRYSYRSQIIPLIYDPVQNSLAVNAGFVNDDAENTYVWKRTCGGTTTIIADTTTSTLYLPPAENGCTYRCEVTNSILTQDHLVRLNNALNATYKRLIAASHFFLYKKTPASLCSYTSGPYECTDVIAGDIKLPVQYTGDTNFIKGATPLQIAYPETYIQADDFQTTSNTFGTINFESTENGSATWLLPDFSDELIPFTSTPVPLGKANLSVLTNQFDATSSLDLNDIALKTPCSDCPELEADFIYFYTEPDCAISLYDTTNNALTVPFKYVDYKENTDVPSVKVSYRPVYNVVEYVDVPANDIQCADGICMVTFNFSSPGMYNETRLKYKLEAVSQSGRRFSTISDYYIHEQREEPIVGYFGTHPDRFNILENLKHPTCDMYWYMWHQRAIINTINSWPAIVNINGTQEFYGHMPETNVDDGWGYRTFLIRKGNFNITSLPSCNTISVTGTAAGIQTQMDYKVICKNPITEQD